MNKIILLPLIAALGLAAPGSAQAPNAGQAPSPVELKGGVKLDKLVLKDGREEHVLTDPEVVVPGDRLLFSTAYRNTSAAPVKDFVVTNPLPQGVVLTPEAANALVVSVDNGRTWGRLAALAVAEGQATRPARADDVTHVRWALPLLAPGASGSFTYNAIVR